MSSLTPEFPSALVAPAGQKVPSLYHQLGGTAGRQGLLTLKGWQVGAIVCRVI